MVGIVVSDIIGTYGVTNKKKKKKKRKKKKKGKEIHTPTTMTSLTPLL